MFLSILCITLYTFAVIVTLHTHTKQATSRFVLCTVVIIPKKTVVSVTITKLSNNEEINYPFLLLILSTSNSFLFSLLTSEASLSLVLLHPRISLPLASRLETQARIQSLRLVCTDLPLCSSSICQKKTTNFSSITVI